MSLKYQLKQLLVNLAADDKIPVDMNQLDPSVFDELIDPIEEEMGELRHRSGVLDDILNNHDEIYYLYKDQLEEEEEED
jgi:hypothetical protein